jgi:hypothetical protein
MDRLETMASARRVARVLLDHFAFKPNEFPDLERNLDPYRESGS